MANVYRIEYETKDFNFKVHIAAHNMEEARLFLLKTVKKQLKINSMQEVCRLDVMAKGAVPEILIERNNSLVAKKEIGQEHEWKCPWCGDTFAKEQGLKIHIGKAHK